MERKRHTIKAKFAWSRGRATLALLAVLAAVGVGYSASAASAAPASQNGSDRALFTSDNAGQVAPSAEVPTLTNDVGQPGGGAGWQLYLGIGLLAVGLLALVYGLAALFTTNAHRDLKRRAARRDLAQRTH